MFYLQISPTSQSHHFLLPKSSPQIRPTIPAYLHFFPSKLPRLRKAAATAATNEGYTTAEEQEEALPDGMKREAMPRHVAVIMDGNVRWARERGLPAGAGHEAGFRSLRQMVEMCRRWGIKVLTVFAFSYDNWSRHKVEVEFLMSLLERGIMSEIDNFNRQGIRISIIGDSSKLSTSLQKVIAEAEETTKNNKRLQLIIAISYSGKYDIKQACRKIAQKAKDGLVKVEDVDEKLLEQELETNCTEYPYPDLLIRSSGELRVSNFLLWQLAYTELFFVKALWPDFGQEKFVEALSSFQQRNRRYGGSDLQDDSGI